MPRRGYHPEWKPKNLLTGHGKHCRRCNTPMLYGIKGAFHTYCLHEYRMEVSWRYVCQQVYARDVGVCAECGLRTCRVERAAITMNVEQFLRHGRPSTYYSGQEDIRLQGNRWLLRLGFRPWERLWQVDHVLPKTQGGSDALDNLRTLCVPCHKHFTAWLAEWRAQQRRY